MFQNQSRIVDQTVAMPAKQTRYRAAAMGSVRLLPDPVLDRQAGDPRYADFFERAYFNLVQAIQNIGLIGGFLYEHQMAPMSVKKFGTANETIGVYYRLKL